MQHYLKAVVAIVGAVLTTVLVQFPDSEQVQTWGPIIATLLTAVGVYLVPNQDPTGAHQDESTQPPSEHGRTDVIGLLVVVILVLVILALVGVL